MKSHTEEGLPQISLLGLFLPTSFLTAMLSKKRCLATQLRDLGPNQTETTGMPRYFPFQPRKHDTFR